MATHVQPAAAALFYDDGEDLQLQASSVEVPREILDLLDIYLDTRFEQLPVLSVSDFGNLYPPRQLAAVSLSLPRGPYGAFLNSEGYPIIFSFHKDQLLGMIASSADDVVRQEFLDTYHAALEMISDNETFRGISVEEQLQHAMVSKL